MDCRIATRNGATDLIAPSPPSNRDTVNGGTAPLSRPTHAIRGADPALLYSEIVAVPRFTDETLTSLRALKRHKDRDWFNEHRADYDTNVKDRMVEIIGRLAEDFARFAPDQVASPRVSLYRIHRDTRFSADKSPYKTHVAAVFPHRTLTKHGGAGLYFHVSPDEVFVGAGIYAPDPRQLYTLRRHVSTNFRRFRTIVESPTFRKAFDPLYGDRLKRPPKGFDADDPAIEYLKLKRLTAGTGKPSTFATGPRFYTSLVRLFEHLTPFVGFLNEPLVRPAKDILEAK